MQPDWSSTRSTGEREREREQEQEQEQERELEQERERELEQEHMNEYRRDPKSNQCYSNVHWPI